MMTGLEPLLTKEFEVFPVSFERYSIMGVTEHV
jgi:hypothetical protein